MQQVSQETEMKQGQLQLVTVKNVLVKEHVGRDSKKNCKSKLALLQHIHGLSIYICI